MRQGFGEYLTQGIRLAKKKKNVLRKKWRGNENFVKQTQTESV